MQPMSLLPKEVREAISYIERGQLYPGSKENLQAAAAWYINSGQSVKAIIALEQIRNR